MRKDKLIALLSELKGNPEILLWNGFVEDWVDIGSFVEYDLVKQSFEDYALRVEYEEKRNRNDWTYKLSEDAVGELKKNYRRVCEWDVNEFVTEEDIKKGHYKKKRVILVNAKPKKKETWDRMGSISY